MASAGIRRRVSARTGRVSYEVWWRLDDGAQGSRTYRRHQDAVEKRNQVLAAINERKGPRRGDIPFERWADHWWTTWASNPRLSPNSLQGAEIRLRKHIKPGLTGRKLEDLDVSVLLRWQHRLEGATGYDTVMACRSLVIRILQLAEDDKRIPYNPMRKVPAPKRPDDPEKRLGNTKPQLLPTTQDAGRLLAAFPLFWWPHVLTLLGTGVRIGEFAGLQRFRAHPDDRRIEVVEVHYNAGKYGKGLKSRPKSTTSIRPLPLPWQAAAAVARALPPGSDPLALVFSGPGRHPHRQPPGARYKIDPKNFRRVYQRVAEKAGLGHLNLRGPHDFRRTYATWLEEAGIPARVIDELMGHAGGRDGDAAQQGSAVGRRYRYTTTAMLDRVTAVLEARLAEVIATAGELLGNEGREPPAWCEVRGGPART